MMNRVLTEGLCASLRARGIAPLLARAVPPNDGGLSLGQAFLARRGIETTGKDAQHVSRDPGPRH
jgi:hydrogenase maturation protein HypF